MVNSRAKGGRGERELVQLYRQAGFPDAGRSPHSGADPRWKGDIIGVPGYHIEAKRTERLRLNDALKQCSEQAGQSVPLLHHRRNQGPWYVTLKLEDWLSVLTEGTHQEPPPCPSKVGIASGKGTVAQLKAVLDAVDNDSVLKMQFYAGHPFKCCGQGCSRCRREAA